MAIYTSSYDWMRNDYNVDIKVGGWIFPTVEHAFQSFKTNDQDIISELTECSVKEARKIGHSLELPSDWDDKKVKVMTILLRKKFEDTDLMQKLVNTGSEHIIADMKDLFWGDVDGTGANYFGLILEDIRKECKIILGEESEVKEDSFDYPTEMEDNILNIIEEDATVGVGIVRVFLDIKKILPYLKGELLEVQADRLIEMGLLDESAVKLQKDSLLTIAKNVDKVLELIKELDDEEDYYCF